MIRMSAINASGSSGSSFLCILTDDCEGLDHAVGAVCVALAGEGVDEIGEGFHGLARDGLVGALSDMRSDDDLGMVEQWVIGGGWFLVKDIGGVTGELAGIESDDHIGLGNEFAAAGVHEP